MLEYYKLGFLKTSINISIMKYRNINQLHVIDFVMLGVSVLNSSYNMGTFYCPICLDCHQENKGFILCCSFNNETDSTNNHTICIDCIRGIAKSAIENSRIAEGGIGLLCPIPECKNVFFISRFLFNYTI